MIEKLRIKKKNEIGTSISELKASIQRLRKALENYQKSEVKFEDLEVENDYKEKRRLECEKQIEEKQKLIVSFEEQIVLINEGKLDEELKKELIKSEKVARKPQIKLAMKPKEENVKNYAKTREMNAERIRQTYLREWNNYTFSQQSLPDYMRKNLKEMTQNKGYIWKGCWFMGEIDSNEDNMITMFEKPNKDSLFIHEYNKEKRIYSLYEKSGQNYKKLILKKNF
jgi:hypothetical protein